VNFPTRSTSSSRSSSRTTNANLRSSSNGDETAVFRA
jgi:hypothetical protein